MREWKVVYERGKILGRGKVVRDVGRKGGSQKGSRDGWDCLSKGANRGKNEPNG